MNSEVVNVMPYERYSKYPFISFPGFHRFWPDKVLRKAPVWCSVDLRDGNQALVNPMSIKKKLQLFHLLISLGFKEIEVGFPSASETDHSFVRVIVEKNLIPENVTIQVLTQAREELIERTFQSLQGFKGKVIIHVYNSTSELQRRVVFKENREGVKNLALQGVMLCKKYAQKFPSLDVVLEYSPESFTGTEPEYALEVCNAVIDVWNPEESVPNLIINLPATVEMSTPNVFADYVQWMGERLSRRENIILSVHPHNDRGTGVAAAELAVMAGADRVEGCLFGNGERTGNVCLITLALNLFSQGVNPELDLSNIDHVRNVVQHCTELPVHQRHPYGGELVYTAFSGSHQDAINKGLHALLEKAERLGADVSEIPWEVPYLPIDPADVGRTYEAIIRVNSQSGKGGVAYVMETEHGMLLPRNLQVEFSQIVQQHTEKSGQEITPNQVWKLFEKTYTPHLGFNENTETLSLDKYSIRNLKPYTVGNRENVSVEVSLHTPKGTEIISGVGNGPVDAFCDALRTINVAVEVEDYHEHAKTSGGDADAVCYVQCTVNGSGPLWGVAVHQSIITSSFHALLTAVNREM